MRKGLRARNNFQRCAPSDLLPPTRLHLLKFSRISENSAISQGPSIQHMNMKYGGYFMLNHNRVCSVFEYKGFYIGSLWQYTSIAMKLVFNMESDVSPGLCLLTFSYFTFVCL
jgi:hypothetical protein